jgi:hypothetical protein
LGRRGEDGRRNEGRAGTAGGRDGEFIDRRAPGPPASGCVK